MVSEYSVQVSRMKPRVSTERSDARWYFEPTNQVLLYLSVAFLFGGGGVSAALPNLIVQLASLLLLSLNLASLRQFVARAPRTLVGLVAVTILVALVQLVPLPPAIWHALPGRGLAVEALSLIGRQDEWRSFALVPNRTMTAFAAFFAGLVPAIVVASLDRRSARQVLAGVVALGGVAILLGVAQLAMQGAVGRFYQEGMSGELVGSFANHNSSGLFLCLVLIALTALPSRFTATAAGRSGVILAGLIVVVGVVLTRSRSSMAVLALLLALGGLVYWPRVKEGLQGFRASRVYGKYFTRVLTAGLAVACLGLGGAAYLLHNGRVEQSLSRFSDLHDARPQIWADSLDSIGRFWPLGAGTGSFKTVFQVDESLEWVTPLLAGRAHDEYLEIAIELGVVGLALVLAWLARVAVTAWQVRALQDRRLRYAALVALGCLALQSLVDYPLRNQFRLVVTGVRAGVFFRLGRQGEVSAARQGQGAGAKPAPAGEDRARRSRAVDGAILGVLALLGLGATLAQMDIMGSTRVDVAERVPHFMRFFSYRRLLGQALEGSDKQAAFALAREQLEANPVPAEPLSAFGVLAIENNQPDLAMRAFSLASQRGWRDSITQQVAANYALEANQPEAAAQRLDGLLRSTGHIDDTYGPLIQEIMARPAFRDEVTRRYLQGPPWADEFFDWVMAHVDSSVVLDWTASVRKMGGSVPCNRLDTVARRIIMSGGSALQARQAWAPCADGQGEVFGVASGNGGGPFAWAYPDVPRLTRDPDGKGMISYVNADIVRAPLAQRIADLAPGTYTFRAQVTGELPSLTLACIHDGKISTVRTDYVKGGGISFEVPAEQCPFQQLTIQAPQGSGTLTAPEVLGKGRMLF